VRPAAEEAFPEVYIALGKKELTNLPHVRERVCVCVS
jgi:hypothetical protein